MILTPRSCDSIVWAIRVSIYVILFIERAVRSCHCIETREFTFSVYGDICTTDCCNIEEERGRRSCNDITNDTCNYDGHSRERNDSSYD